MAERSMNWQKTVHMSGMLRWICVTEVAMRLGLTGDSVDPGNCSIMRLSCCENVMRMLLRGSDYAEAMMPDAPSR